MADVKFTLSTIDDYTSKINKLENAFKKVNGEANKLGSVKFNDVKLNTSKITKSSFDRDYDKALKEIETKQKQSIKSFIAKENADIRDFQKVQSRIGDISNYNRNLIKKIQKKESQVSLQSKSSISWLNSKSNIKNNFDSDFEKALKERSLPAISSQEKQRQINEMFKTQEESIKNQKKIQNQALQNDINLRNRELNFNKSIEKQKEKIQKERVKIEEKANKAEIRANLEKFKLNQKIADSYRTAKVTPINYATDSSGKVIGVSKAGSATRAEMFSLNNLGGNYIKKDKIPKSGGGFGGGRTFGNVLKAYGSYRVISGLEQGINSMINTPLSLEQARASIGAMLFASGTPREELGAAVEDDMKFIFEMAQKYKSDPLNIANNYKMALSTMASKTPGKRSLNKNEIRGITEGFLNISRVSGLTADDSSSVFLALSQMLGKEKIQAQEVNLQMSQRIPAIKNLLRKTVEETIKDPRLAKMYEPYKKLSLDEMMEKGIISSDVLVNFQKVVDEIFQDMYKEKGKTLTAESQGLGASFKELSDTTTKDLLPHIGRLVNAINTVVQYVNSSLKGDEGKYKKIWDDPDKTLGQKITGSTYKATSNIVAPTLATYASLKMIGKFLPKIAKVNPWLTGAVALATAGSSLYEELSTPNNYNNDNNINFTRKPDTDKNNQQTIELILKLEGNTMGISPIVSTADGRKLNLGKNLIAGERKANGY